MRAIDNIVKCHKGFAAATMAHVDHLLIRFA